ncbi:MAG: DUF4407 domain-containing protein [Bacteroidales bacterium]
MESSYKNNIEPHSYRFDFIYRFFCWCSGARLYLLKSCPTDYNKYFGIGIIVFLTGIMACLTGFFASFMIFESVLLSLVFSIFWGILIFFLDWYIVSSLKKEDKILSEILFALPRLILALFLAVAISKPLELKLFEKEIDAELQKIQTQKNIDLNVMVDSEYEDVALLKQENEKLYNELKQKEELRNKLFNLMIEEAEGKSPTARIGKGSVYKEKKDQFEKIDTELKELKINYNALIDKNLLKIDQLEKTKQEKTLLAKENIGRADGLLARLEASAKLSDSNDTIKYAGWFIFLLFVIIESSPILVKLLSQRGPYDELIEKEEFEKQVEFKKQKIKAKILANNYLELLKQKDELEIESEKRNNEKLIKEIEAAKEEINKLAVGKWKQKEIDQITSQVGKINEELKENSEEQRVEQIQELPDNENETQLLIDKEDNAKS